MTKLFNQDLYCETSGSAGFDIVSEGSYSLQPGEHKLISTGLYFEDALPNDYYLAIVPRSGLANKFGITVLNSPATVDADYTGEIKVMLVNHGSETYIVKHRDRIAQGIIFKHYTHDFLHVKDAVRGDGGFGSTGVK